MTPSSSRRAQIAAVSSVPAPGVAVAHELDAEVEARPVNGADERVPLAELSRRPLGGRPSSRAFSCSPSSRRMSSTVSPTVQLTGLPPAEEKK